MKCLAAIHVANEHLGCFAPVLTECGYNVEYRQAGVDAITRAEWIDADLVVILGGPIGVSDADEYPWMPGQIADVAARLRERRPTLGICLGAQIMAAALGAPVYAGTAEVGFAPIVLTAEAQDSPLQLLVGTSPLHWHGDTFTLPDDAIRLASTAATENQAFSVGTHALAVQFHPEVTRREFETWLIANATELRHSNRSVVALRAEAALHADAAADAGAAMLRRWLRALS
jgi:GMP synthase (glutamine-hydrolysing)